MPRVAATGPVLDRRTLNRTLLRRQHLLERVDWSPSAMVEHLVGLQAQEPPDPYVGLWARLEPFDPSDLSALIEGRAAVRMGLMRTTLHLVTERDARGLYPRLHDVLRRAWGSSPFAKQLKGVDLDGVLRAAEAALAERPLTPSQLGAVLAPAWPDREPTALAYAARFLLPLVQVPPRGLWQRTGRATNTTLEAWLGQPLEPPTDEGLDVIVLRYLAVFGPATTSDIRTWSWRTGLAPVVETLRPSLAAYRDERGRELLDVPAGAIEDGATPAPVRFLPQYDNVFLSHADRSRIVVDGLRLEVLGWKGGILVDGFLRAAWRLRPGETVLAIDALGPMTADERRQVMDEAHHLLAFLRPDGPAPDIRFDE